jgi:hypothetical protein
MAPTAKQRRLNSINRAILQTAEQEAERKRCSVLRYLLNNAERIIPFYMAYAGLTQEKALIEYHDLMEVWKSRDGRRWRHQRNRRDVIMIRG